MLVANRTVGQGPLNSGEVFIVELNTENEIIALATYKVLICKTENDGALSV